MPARKRVNSQLKIELDKDKVVTALVAQYQHAYTNERTALTRGDIPTVYYWQGKQSGILDAGTALGISRDLIRDAETWMNGHSHEYTKESAA